MKKIVITSVAVLLALAVAGVIWMSSQLSPGVAEGDSLPEVALTDLDGETVDVTERHAGKLILLDFWSST